MRLQRREPRGVILPLPVERDEHQRLQLVDADAEDIAGVANDIGFAGRALLGPFLAFGALHHDRLSIGPEDFGRPPPCEHGRSDEHTSELQSLMRISYAVCCLKKKNASKPNDVLQI